MSLQELFETIEKGGRGSGNFGHSGVPGKRGGSSSGGGHSLIGIKPGMSKEEIGKKLDEHKGKKGIKKDEYGREIKTDEYGSYTSPTTESIKYATNKLDSIDNEARNISDNKTKLQDELSKLEYKKGSYVASRERKVGGMLGGGQDYASIAPKTRAKISEIKQQITEHDTKLDNLLKDRNKLFMEFGAELSKSGKV